MKSFGQVAFEAYRARRGGKNHDDTDTPEWHELGHDIQEAWEAAAEAVAEITDPERGEHLAANVKSFVEGIGFVAPEALDLHVRTKLAEPLAVYYEGRS